MKTRIAVSFVTLLISGLAAAQTDPTPEPTRPSTLSTDQVGHVYAEIETSKGDIEAELDFQRAPLTVMNFVGLAEGTLPFTNRPANQPFFDGLTFHRVVKDFVIQGVTHFRQTRRCPPINSAMADPATLFPMNLVPACVTMRRACCRWPTMVPIPTAASSSSRCAR